MVVVVVARTRAHGDTAMRDTKVGRASHHLQCAGLQRCARCGVRAWRHVGGLLGPATGNLILLQPAHQPGVLTSKPHVAGLQVMGCALLLPLGGDEEGVPCAELGAFCVDPAFR